MKKPQKRQRMSTLELAKQFAKLRGQAGRGVSEKDIKKALEMLQKTNKKFMTGR